MANINGFDIVAPRLLDCVCNEAAVLGAATWLWLHSERHKHVPLHTLSTLLLPAIKHNTFILVSESDRPVFYMAWADLDAEAERRYLRQSPEQMRHDDWCSGDRRWILDWVAPFGHNHAMGALVRRQLFAGALFRTLYHRGAQTGLRIKHLHGSAVLPQEARLWFADHPPMWDGACAEISLPPQVQYQTHP